MDWNRLEFVCLSLAFENEMLIVLRWQAFGDSRYKWVRGTVDRLAAAFHVRRADICASNFR